MTASYEEYREILERVPHIQRVEITEGGPEGVRVQVVSQSPQSPRHVAREVVSLLRTAGWKDISADNVVIVHIQRDDEPRQSIGRLQIAGFSVTYGASGYEASCRLRHGSNVYEGEGVGSTSVLAVARATLGAVNRAFGPDNGIHLVDATQLTVSGVALSLVLVTDPDGEVMAGNAVQREVTGEETMMRAVLDAINRRFVLYTGQKI